MKLDKLCCFFSNIAYKSKNDMVKIFSSKEVNNEYSFLNSYSVPTFYSSDIDAQCFVTKKDKRIISNPLVFLVNRINLRTVSFVTE